MTESRIRDLIKSINDLQPLGKSGYVTHEKLQDTIDITDSEILNLMRMDILIRKEIARPLIAEDGRRIESFGYILNHKARLYL